MERVFYTTGWRSETEFAYSRAIRAGKLIFVSGTTGYDLDTMSEGAGEQTEMALANIGRALANLGGDLNRLVQLATNYQNNEDWPAIGSVIGRVLKDVRPTNSVIRTGLIRPLMKVEISAIAIASGPAKA